MNTNSKTAIEGTRGTIFFIEPEKLTRVIEEKHPLYDVRVHKPFNEGYVQLMLKKGFKKTQVLTIRKNGPLLEIVDGRQRHAAALEVNKRRRAAGEPEVKIPVMLEIAKSDVEAAETMIIATYMREQDDVITAAEKVVDYMTKFSRTDEDAALIFGVTTKTISTYETLVQLSAAVKKAVREARISAHAAVAAFGGMTREDQEKNLERVLESAPARKSKGGSNGETGEGTGEKKNKKDSPIARLRVVFRNEGTMDALSKRERTLVEWMFGKVSMGDLMGAHPALAEAIDVAQKAKKAKKAKEARAEKTEGGNSAPRVAGTVSRN